MKFRTKLLCLFAGMTLLSTGALTAYSALELRSQYVRSELSAQMRTIRLLSNAVLGQYFAYINQQIIAVLSTRSELREQSLILSHYIENYTTHVRQLTDFLHGQQDSFNQVDKDLLLLKADEMLVSPHYEEALTARSVGGQTLLEQLKSGSYRSADGSFTVLFAADRRRGNYLSYTRTLGPEQQYTLCVLQNIDSLMQHYAADDAAILPQLREGFEVMKHSLNGAAAVIEASDFNVILSTAPSGDQFLSGIDLKELLVKDQTERNLELTAPDGSRYFAVISYFKPLNWYLIIYRAKNSVIAPAVKLAQTSLIIGLAVLLLSMLLAFLLSGRLTRALNLIAMKADEIAGLNLRDPQAIASISAKLKSGGDDEVASVGRALALMGRSISENLQQLIAANQRQDRLLGELKAASAIQDGMLPAADELPSSAYIDLSAYLLPAKEVGGDLYDALRLNDDEIALIIGDVSDKGVPAALFMSTALSLTRCALSLNFSPRRTMEFLNQRLSERNPNLMFVTMFIMILNEKSGVYRACNAGHCYPLIIGRRAVRELDLTSGPAAGPLPEAEYSEFTGTLKAGETLVLYTDGVSEAQNAAREFFGTARLTALCAGRFDRPAEETLQEIVKAAARFRGSFEQTDDLTLLTCRRRQPKTLT